MTDRPRVDQLTDDMLDQLYAERDQLAIRVWNAEDASTAWERKADEQQARAEKAEAELDALKTVTTGYCPHCGRGDCSPTADQWLEQRQRADRAEAAIARVRAECDRIESAVNDNPTNGDLAGGFLACLRHIRAALDGTT